MATEEDLIDDERGHRRYGPDIEHGEIDRRHTVNVGFLRFSREISVGVLAFLILQAVAFIIFATTQNNKLESLLVAFNAAQAQQYTKNDAQREREFIEQKFLIIQTRNDELVRRVGVLEGQVNELMGRARAAR